MLLDTLEEQLDLPAAFVELSHGDRGDGEAVGQEDQAVSRVGVAVSDAAQIVGIVAFGMEAGGAHGLIADQACRLVDRPCGDPPAVELGARPGDEEGAGLVEGIEPLEVEVATVHDIEGAGLDQRFVEQPRIVPSAVADLDDRRDGAAQIEQRVEFDGGLGALEGGPGEELETEVDGRGVEGICLRSTPRSSSP